MRLLKILTIISFFTVIGIVIESCCEGYSYKWTYFFANNLENDSISEKDSISIENYGIRLQFFDQKFNASRNNPFINEAYATSCEPAYINLDTITSIEIITKNVLNNDYGALSDVSNLFYGSSERDYDQTKWPINELIYHINYFDKNTVRFVDFAFKDINVNKAVHQFIIKIKLSDSRVLVDSTKAVKIY
jgi:hypothetical protein